MVLEGKSRGKRWRNYQPEPVLMYQRQSSQQSKAWIEIVDRSRARAVAMKDSRKGHFQALAPLYIWLLRMHGQRGKSGNRRSKIGKKQGNQIRKKKFKFVKTDPNPPIPDPGEPPGHPLGLSPKKNPDPRGYHLFSLNKKWCPRPSPAGWWFTTNLNRTLFLNVRLICPILPQFWKWNLIYLSAKCR